MGNQIPLPSSRSAPRNPRCPTPSSHSIARRCGGLTCHVGRQKFKHGRRTRWVHDTLRLSAFSGLCRTSCFNWLFTGSIHDIDSSITQLHDLLSIFPRSDPGRFHPLFSLARKRRFRYIQLNQKEDLDKEIDHLTELILLSPLSLLQRGQNILAALFHLAYALFLRSNVSKQREDAICATRCFCHLRDQPHEIPGIPRRQVTALLVDAVALQVMLEAGNSSMADPGEFMIPSGSRPFRARLVRSVLTGYLQDLSTTSIPPSHNCRTFSLFSLDLILVAFNLCFLWPESDTSDTYS